MNELYNPDYPVNVGSFVQHTYGSNGNQYDQTFYYGGGSINPFDNNAMSQIPPDSRRNMGSPYLNPQNNNGYSQIPQSGIPAPQASAFTTNPNNGGSMPFNSLIESRRNIPNQQQVAVQPQSVNPVFNNPWDTQSVGTVNPNFSNPYVQPDFGYGYPAVEMSSSALYGNPNQFGFDRKQGCWDNMYTTPRAPEMPNVEWNNGYNLNPINQQPQYQNVVQYPKTNESWAEIATKNWK